MLGFKHKNRNRNTPRREPKRRINYAYYSNRSSVDDSEPRQIDRKAVELRRQKFKHWLKNTPAILASLAIAFSIFYSLKLDSNPQIIQLKNAGNLYLHDKSTYTEAAYKLFSRSVLNDNKVTVNVSGITSQLKSQFPELSNVSIVLPLINHQPLVYIEASVPAIILDASNGTFVLNNQGIAITNAYQANNISNLELPTVTDNSNISVKLGQIALPTGHTAFISEVYRQLTANKLKVSSMSLKPASNELDVYIKGQDYYAKFNMLGNGREQAGAFIASAKQLSGQHQLPKSYFDMRVEGRVYYK